MIYLRHLKLINFRNFERVSFDFSPRVNLIIGKNGQGKTNLLESIGLLMSGKSFRTPLLKDLIMSGKNGFCIEAQFSKSGIDQTLHIYFDPQKKKVCYNDTSYGSFLPLIGNLQGVLFAGYHNQLIKGSPQDRSSQI